MPIHAEDYVHRIGRTGRAGRSGAAFTLVTKRDTKFVDAIEKLIDKKIEWLNGDLSALPAPMESHDSGRSERAGRDGKRGGRRNDRDREHAPPIAAQPVRPVTNRTPNRTIIRQPHVEPVTAKAEPVRTERKAETKPQNAGRQRQPSCASPYPANDDNRDRRNRYRRDQDDGPTPIGFGDDIPAFMLIAGKA